MIKKYIFSSLIPFNFDLIFKIHLGCSGNFINGISIFVGYLMPMPSL